MAVYQGAGRTLYNTDMYQGMLAGQSIHTSTYNEDSMPFNNMPWKKALIVDEIMT